MTGRGGLRVQDCIRFVQALCVIDAKGLPSRACHQFHARFNISSPSRRFFPSHLFFCIRLAVNTFIHYLILFSAAIHHHEQALAIWLSKTSFISTILTIK